MRRAPLSEIKAPICARGNRVKPPLGSRCDNDGQRRLGSRISPARVCRANPRKTVGLELHNVGAIGCSSRQDRARMREAQRRRSHENALWTPELSAWQRGVCARSGRCIRSDLPRRRTGCDLRMFRKHNAPRNKAASRREAPGSGRATAASRAPYSAGSTCHLRSASPAGSRASRDTPQPWGATAC